MAVIMIISMSVVHSASLILYDAQQVFSIMNDGSTQFSRMCRRELQRALFMMIFMCVVHSSSLSPV